MRDNVSLITRDPLARAGWWVLALYAAVLVSAVVFRKQLGRDGAREREVPLIGRESVVVAQV